MKRSAGEQSLVGRRASAERPEEQKRVAIALFEHFSMLDVGGITEVFNLANRLHSSPGREANMYTVSLLSSRGGAVSSTSGIRVFTDGFDAPYASGFDALFIADGGGATVAAQDESMLSWVRESAEHTQLLYACGQGRLILAAAGLPAGRISESSCAETNLGPAAPISIRARLGVIDESLSVALSFVEASSHQTARCIADRLTGQASPRSSDSDTSGNGEPMSEAIGLVVRHIQKECEQSLTVSQLASMISMSERNFLRRFKQEMNMTPSEFLQAVRLERACALLTYKNLPVDKVARHTGLGAGDRLAKLFRQRFAMSPTEYRIASRLTAKKAR